MITLGALILYYSTLSSTNRQILTRKRYDEHPRDFEYEEYYEALLHAQVTLVWDLG